MAITNPLLTPRPGYVEVEIDGQRVYRKIITESEQAAQDRIAQLELDNATLSARLQASINSNAMLEDCLVEMAGVVYA